MKKGFVKKALSLFLAGVMAVGLVPATTVSAASKIAINKKNFPSEAVRVSVSEYDYNGDGYLSNQEMKDITYLYVSGYSGKFDSLKGVEKLSYLNYLSIWEYTGKKIDISKLKKVENINIYESYKLSSLKLNKNIEGLYVDDCPKLQNFDISKYKKLASVSFDGTGISKLDVSNNVNLTYISVASSRLKEFKASKKNVNLYSVYVYNNPIASLDLSMLNVSDVGIAHTNVALDSLKLKDKKDIMYLSIDCIPMKSDTLDLSEFTNLQSITASENKIKSVKLADYNRINYMDLSVNELKEIDLSGCRDLSSLVLDYNELTALDVSGLNELYYLSAGYNKLESIDVTSLAGLSSISVVGNNMTELDVSKNEELYMVSADNTVRVKVKPEYEGNYYYYDYNTDSDVYCELYEQSINLALIPESAWYICLPEYSTETYEWDGEIYEEPMNLFIYTY